MPLNLPGLTSGLTDFFENYDSENDTEATQASRWADEIRTFTTAIVPAVLPPAQDAAKAAFEAALSGMSGSGAGIAIFDSAFAAYATALAAAMIPAPPGGNVPPPVLLSVTLSPVFVSNNMSGVTAAQAATSIATVIQAWFITGTSNAVPWS